MSLNSDKHATFQTSCFGRCEKSVFILCNIYDLVAVFIVRDMLQQVSCLAAHLLIVSRSLLYKHLLECKVQ